MAYKQGLTPEQQQWLDENINLAERISMSLTSSDEFLALLIGVLNRIETNTAGGGSGDGGDLAKAIDALTAAITGGSIDLKNPPRIATGQVVCATAATPQQLPRYQVPYRKPVMVKGLPTNLGVIGVGNSPQESSNNVSQYPILAQEIVEYEVEYTDTIWITSTVAGEGIAWTVEQE